MSTQFRFRYRPEQDLVDIDRIINVGDVVPSYGGSGGVYQNVHVWATNVGSFDVYRPAVYILHQDYESRTATSKPQNMRNLLTQVKPDEGPTWDPFAQVVFSSGDSYYFDHYNGTRNNPIPIPLDDGVPPGELVLKHNILCMEIGKTVDFWIRIENTHDISAGGFQKDIEDGKWGFSLRMTGDIHG